MPFIQFEAGTIYIHFIAKDAAEVEFDAIHNSSGWLICLLLLLFRVMSLLFQFHEMSSMI